MVVTFVSFDEFGPYVRSLRKAKGMTQKELQAKAGIHANYVYILEKGREIPIRDIKLIAEALGINVNLAISIDPNDLNRLQEVQNSE